MPKTSTKQEKPENEQNTTLVGWVRQSRAGGALKISVHSEAISNCHTYTTVDGTSYIPLVISMSALRRVIDGEQSLTTVSQFRENGS